MKRLRSLKTRDLNPKNTPKTRKTRDAEEPKQDPDVEKVYGCSRCRYAKLGCKTCKNPNFKPRRRRNHVESSTNCSPKKAKKGSTGGSTRGDDKKVDDKKVDSRKKKTQPAEEPPAPPVASKPKIRRSKTAKGGPAKDVD